MRKRTTLVAVVVLLLVFGGGFVYFSNRNLQAVFSNSPQQEKTITIEPKTIENSVTLSGDTDAEKKAVLRFQSSGKLVWVGVKEGDSVKEGQAIASLDQRELQKKLERTLKDYMITRWDFEQAKDDNKGDYTGTWNQYTTDKITRLVQQEQFGLDQSVIDVELATLSKELSLLIAPFAGIVTRIEEPFPGVNITPAQAEFEIIDPATLFLSATADQQDVVHLKKGVPVSIVFDALPDETYKGAITYISYTPATGDEHSYMIKISLPKRVGAILRLGMSADVTVATQKKKGVFTVPQEALFEDKGKTYVTVRKNGNKQKREVKTGMVTENEVEIISGLSSQDIVIVP